MIKESDFQALIKVFHGAVKEIAELPTYEERKAVVFEWIELMGMVDRALTGIITETSLKERRRMVTEGEIEMKNLGLELSDEGAKK